MLAHAYLAETYVAQGRGDDARSHWEHAIAISDRLGLHWWTKRLQEEMQTQGGTGSPAA